MGNNKELINKEPTIPGFGVAGLVMCDTFKSPCIKQACEKWIELKCGDTFVGRCCYSWVPVLLTEIRQSLDKLIDKINMITSNKEQNEDQL